MPIKPYLIATSLVFTLVTIIQLLRIIQQWAVMIDGVAIPLWVSGVIVIITVALAVSGFMLSARDPYLKKIR